MKSGSFKSKDGTQFRTHAYRNVKTGKVVELKTKLADLERLQAMEGGTP